MIGDNHIVQTGGKERPIDAQLCTDVQPNTDVMSNPPKAAVAEPSITTCEHFRMMPISLAEYTGCGLCRELASAYLRRVSLLYLTLQAGSTTSHPKQAYQLSRSIDSKMYDLNAIPIYHF
jgi:hypothetical protein